MRKAAPSCVRKLVRKVVEKHIWAEWAAHKKRNAVGDLFLAGAAATPEEDQSGRRAREVNGSGLKRERAGYWLPERKQWTGNGHKLVGPRRGVPGQHRLRQPMGPACASKAGLAVPHVPSKVAHIRSMFLPPAFAALAIAAVDRTAWRAEQLIPMLSTE